MKKVLFLLITILCSLFVPAQQPQIKAVISGKLVDEKALPLAFANVLLLRSSDSSLAASSLSGADGKFTIDMDSTGSYFLRISSIGFIEINTEKFTINTINLQKDFGTIGMKTEAGVLADVSVTALRPTIVQKADKMVVTIEGTAMAAGNTAYDVLSRAPGVFMDAEGNIQLNGRAGVTVMINGKLTFLSARDLRTMLEGMSAENIKDIEIIVNPSAKYDAEGTSGILNINLKKNTLRGINGSIYAGYNSNFKQNGYSYGANINHRSGKWNSFINADGLKRVGGREATFTRVFYDVSKTTYFDQEATADFVVKNPVALRAGTDYNFTDNHSLGLTTYFSLFNVNDNFLTETFMGNAPKNPNLFIDARNITAGEGKNFTTNLHYQGKLDTAGRTLSADLDYVRIRNHNKSNFYNYFTNFDNAQQTQDFLFTDIPRGFDIYSLKFDYSTPVKGGSKFETGAKASRVISDNDSRFYFNNNGLVPDPARTNHFNYKETIAAVYANWSGNLSKKVSLQTGLRAEQTTSRGISFTTSTVTDRNYLNLFPSVFLQHQVSEKYGINYSYSRRLTRPNYGNLNPFRSYRDPYTWTEGNPYLRPQYTNSFSVGQTFFKRYILTLSYQHNTDVMTELPILDVANAVTIYTTGNVDDGHNYSATAIVPLKIFRWWDAQNTLLLAFARFTTMSNNGPLKNEQLFHMIQSNHTIQLPLSIRMELNLLFRGPAASGLYQMAPMSRVDAGIKRSFFNKKFDLSVNANDIFKTYRFLWTTDINGNVNEFNQYLRWRNVGVTLRYNFSRGQKVDTKRRNNQLEEMNRT